MNNGENQGVSISNEQLEKAFKAGAALLSPDSELPVKMKDAENLLILRMVLVALLSGQYTLTPAKPKDTRGPIPVAQPEAEEEAVAA